MISYHSLEKELFIGMVLLASGGLLRNIHEPALAE